MSTDTHKPSLHLQQSNRTLWAIGLLIFLSAVALWWNLFDYYNIRLDGIRSTWVNLELQIVQSAGRMSQSWLKERIEIQKIPKWDAEQEAFRLFIKPIHLLENSQTWFYNSSYIIYDQKEDFPAEHKGKNIAEIFELQRARGASHYEEIVQSVTAGKEGTGWYIWETGGSREYVAWTIVRLSSDVWVIGLATPEAEILEFSNFRTEWMRSMLGTISATLLLGIIFFLIYLQWQRGLSEVKRLEKSVAERTDQLAQSEERYRTLVERITAITYIDAVDEDSTTLFISPQVETVLGNKPEDWYADGKLWEKLIHPDDRERVLAEHKHSNTTGKPFQVDYRMIHRDGHVVWIRDEASLISKDGENAVSWHGVMYDITSPKLLEEKLRYLGIHDALTGLYNRAYFEEEMARLERGRGYPISILVSDVDGLKKINDTYGHPVGDLELKHVAHVMRKVFRVEDIVARTGGDEFAVILSSTDASGAQNAIERIRKMIVQEAGQDPWSRPGLSIGFSTGEKGCRLADIYKKADDCMYKEKALKKQH